MLRGLTIAMTVALCACGGDEEAADDGRHVLEGDALNTQGLVLATGEVVSVQNTNDLDEAGLGGSDIYLHVGNTRLLVGGAPPGSDDQLAFCLQGEDHASVEAISTETMYCKWQAANLGAPADPGEDYVGHGFLLRPPSGGMFRLLIVGLTTGDGAQTTVTFAVAPVDDGA
ncbi:MAG: hypothetical protein RIF41_15270 [Polyangiaceae bacterium]